MSINVSVLAEKFFGQNSWKRAILPWLKGLEDRSEPLPIIIYGGFQPENNLFSQYLFSLLKNIDPTWKRLQKITAEQLIQSWNNFGYPVFPDSNTLIYIPNLEEILKLPADTQFEFTTSMKNYIFNSKARLTILACWNSSRQLPPTFESIQFFPIQFIPLYQRGNDIFRLIQLFSKELIEELTSKGGGRELDSLSLEAITHIHRAVIQKRKETPELHAFLRELLERAHSGSIPLIDGIIPTWPVVRALEEKWSYRAYRQPESFTELENYDYQLLLFDAALENASIKSKFSPQLLSMQCQLLWRLLEELPPHQRNYQGMTGALDKLLWISMKLISNARTQSEFREFFGFGSKGKIPKATAKLKFDQYNLAEYGTSIADPFLRPPETKILDNKKDRKSLKEKSEIREHSDGRGEKPRQWLEITGEELENLFWRYQDLLAVLAASPAKIESLASFFSVSTEKIAAILKRLERVKIVEKKGDKYAIPSDDLYLKHRSFPIAFVEQNLQRGLRSALSKNPNSFIENIYLYLPEGLPALRREILTPFINEQLLPLASEGDLEERPYLYSFIITGTDRLSAYLQKTLPIEEQVEFYLRQAILQRTEPSDRDRAICLQVSLLMSERDAERALQNIKKLNSSLSKYVCKRKRCKANYNFTISFAPLRPILDRNEELN